MTDLGELDALIVEHIADLEAAQRRINETLDPRLLHDVSEMMKERARALGWVHDTDKTRERFWIAPEDWIERDKAGKIHSWFSFFELAAVETGGELQNASHLAEFLDLQGSSKRQALSFSQKDTLTRRKFSSVLDKNPKEVEALRDLGFKVDQQNGLISLPIRLDADALKRGFETNQLEAALTPVQAAIDLAVQAMPHFQVLAAEGRVLAKE